jgi:tRNA pseudouridine38-40 synthase
VASARVTFGHDAAVVARALNGLLPPDVRVVAVADAPPDFHARLSAHAKVYRYLIANTPVASPFTRAYAWHVPEPLDVDAMRQAASALVGTHDFAAFQSTGSAVATTVRTITRSDVRPYAAGVGDDEGMRLLAYEVEGDGFLRHMVRAMVGTLVDVGRGVRAQAQVLALLRPGSRADAGATAPAHGLFLVRVEY